MLESRWITAAVAALAAVAYSLWISFARHHWWVQPKPAGILVGFAAAAILGYPAIVGCARIAAVLSREFGRVLAGAAIAVFAFFALSFIVLFVLGALWDWETRPVNAGVSLAGAAAAAIAVVACVVSLRGSDPSRWFSWRVEMTVVATAVATGLWYLVRESSRSQWRGDAASIAMHIALIVLFSLSAAAAAHLAESTVEASPAGPAAYPPSG